MNRWYLSVLTVTGILVIFLLFNRCTRSSEYPGHINVATAWSVEDSLNSFDSLITHTSNLDHQASLRFGHLALNVAKHGTPCDLARANMLMGIASYADYPDSSFQFYTEGLHLSADSACPGIRARLLYNMAMIQHLALNEQATILYLDSAIVEATRTGDQITLSNTYNILGAIKEEMGDTAAGLKARQTSFEIARKHHLSRSMGVAWSNLARMKLPDRESINMFKEAITMIQKEPGSEQDLGTIYTNLGYAMTNSDSAIFYLQKALDIGRLCNDHQVIVYAFNNMAYSYMEKKDLKQARACLVDEAIPLAEKDNNAEWLADLYDSYSDVLLAAGDGNQAALYLKKSIAASKQAVSHQKSKQIQLLLTLLDVKNKESMIRDREEEIRVRHNREQIMQLVIILLFLIVLLTGVMALVIRQRGRMKIHLQEMETARSFVALEEQEKSRIAMQLHDLTGPIGNLLTKQIRELDLTEPAMKANIGSRLESIAATLRHLSHRMNKTMMEQLTFSELIEGLRRDLSLLSDLPIILEVGTQCEQLPASMNQHVYFMVLELMNNATKHVPSGEVHLTLSVENNNFYIFYRDQGPGFDPEMVKLKGMGLMNIIERARLLKGHADLSSRPGEGTRWIISIPL